MPKFEGIFDFEGTMQNMTFYKSKDGTLVKKKGSISKSRIADDPAFARTRENGAEFGHAAQAGKLLRDSFKQMVKTSSDYHVTSRITKVMSKVRLEDSTSPRGQRSVANGIATPAGKALLTGFNFNEKAPLSEVLFSAYTLDNATGIISIPGFVPLFDVIQPEGATHVSLTGAFGKINFSDGSTEVYDTNVENLPIDSVSTDVTLTPTAVPALKATAFYLLQVNFFELVNGVQYALNNSTSKALCIIEVA